MATKDELQRAFGAAAHVVAEQRIIRATVGIANTDGTFTLQEETRPHRVWVTTDRGTVLEVANMGVPLVAGTPVLVDLVNGDQTAIGIDYARAVATMGESFPLQTVGPHTHRRGFGLDDYVEEDRFEPGMLYAGDDLEVRVKPFWYAQDGYWPDTTTLDLAGNQPAAGQHRWVRIGFDVTGPSLEAADGTAVPVTIPLNMVDIASIALSRADIIPIGAVKLDGDQATWHGPEDFVSARLLIGAESGSGDVTGPGSSTDNAIARFDGAGGKTLQDSGVTIDDNDRLTLPDDADYPPLNVTERSVAPSSPAANDIYLDDGTNTASGDPGWRRWNGAAWEDVSAGGGGGGSPTLTVVNNSGGAVVAGNVGLLQRDATDGYEYVETTTEEVGGLWCVVETGGADGAAITVKRSGTQVTVNYTGSAPNIGYYLTTSTTAGKAQGRSLPHFNMFAVCTGNGAGGEVEATLLCNTRFQSLTSDHWFYRSDDLHGNSDFVATINGAPTSTSFVYNAPSAGDEKVLAPYSANQLALLVVWNTTRGTERLVTAVNTGTNTVTTVSSTDAWANGDTVTIRSQILPWPSSPYFIDVDISQQSEIPETARTLHMQIAKLDTGAGNLFHMLHPYVAFSEPKIINMFNQVAAYWCYAFAPIPLIDQRLIVRFKASGAATSYDVLVCDGYWEAVP
jgi:hypothetical protein